MLGVFHVRDANFDTLVENDHGDHTRSKFDHKLGMLMVGSFSMPQFLHTFVFPEYATTALVVFGAGGRSKRGREVLGRHQSVLLNWRTRVVCCGLLCCVHADTVVL